MKHQWVWPLFFILGMHTHIEATPINLNPCQSEFRTLMNSVARDVAPSLSLGALSGDLQGDAAIDHFSFLILGVGLTTSDGLGEVLRSDTNTHWGFILPLTDLVNKNVGSSNWFEKLMIYPALKVGVGFALPADWDVSFTGIYFPQGIVGFAKDSSPSGIRTKMDQLNPQFSFANFGVQVRKALIQDSGNQGFTPAFCLGAGYHYPFFNLGVKLQSLSSLGLSPPSLGDNQTFDLAGSFSVKSSAQIVTLDLQTSKHVTILTPFVKLTAAYQNSNFAGSSDLDATVTDSTVAASPVVNHQPIAANPEVSLSNLSFLTTVGTEMNLFVVILHASVTSDLGRAFWNVRSLKGIAANAFSLNIGPRWRV